MGTFTNHHTAKHPAYHIGNINEIEEAHEATFTNLNRMYENNTELVGEDDDDENEDRREGRTAARVTDSRGILVEDENYDGA